MTRTMLCLVLFGLGFAASPAQAAEDAGSSAQASDDELFVVVPPGTYCRVGSVERHWRTQRVDCVDIPEPLYVARTPTIVPFRMLAAWQFSLLACNCTGARLPTWPEWTVLGAFEMVLDLRIPWFGRLAVVLWPSGDNWRECDFLGASSVDMRNCPFTDERTPLWGMRQLWGGVLDAVLWTDEQGIFTDEQQVHVVGVGGDRGTITAEISYEPKIFLDFRMDFYPVAARWVSTAPCHCPEFGDPPDPISASAPPDDSGGDALREDIR